MSEAVQVIIHKHPDEAMLADVAAVAEKFYGQTPAKLEAIGFFVAAYSAVVGGHIARFNARGAQ